MTRKRKNFPNNRRLLVFAFSLLNLACWTGTGSAMPPVQRTVLANKLTLLVAPEHSLPFITLQLLVDAGSRQDPPGEEGLANLAARGLLWGTAKRTAAAINEELDFMGASLSSGAGSDYATLGLRVLKKDLDKGLDLFNEVLTQPTFPEKEVEREVGKTLAAIQAAEDQPEEVAEKEFQKDLFLTSPYAHPVEGTKESLPWITPEALVRFYRQFYHPGNSILSVVGDISPEELKAKLLPLLEKWPPAQVPENSFKTALAAGPKTVKIQRSITQANIILGHGGVSRGNPDFYALAVMNYILGGGGFSSRLMEEIRTKRGLAYSVASFFDPHKNSGSFQIVLQTKNASAKEAISLSLKQMEQIRQEKVSAKELEGAQKYLVGSFPMRFDTQGKLVNFLNQVEYFGLGLNYPEQYPRLIRSVSQNDILRVARTYLHPQHYILVIVADLKEAGLE